LLKVVEHVFGLMLVLAEQDVNVIGHDEPFIMLPFVSICSRAVRI
jgi:hypothetical protein